MCRSLYLLLIKCVEHQCRDQEPTSPHRTTFLKVLDSYLLRALATNSPPRKAEADQYNLNQVVSAIGDELLSFLLVLVDYANSSLKRSVGSLVGTEDAPSASEPSSGGAAPKPLLDYDPLLPKVCESIILVAQSFCTLSLAKGDGGTISPIGQRTVRLLTDASLPQGIGVIEALIGEAE